MALTPAQTYLVKRQRRFPPLYRRQDGLDRAQQLYRLLDPGLPESLRALIQRGTVAIAEVGQHVPYARTICIVEGSYAVEFSSGLMDFQYAFMRALSGLDSDNASLPVNRTEKEIAAIVDKLLGSWKRYIKWAPLWPWRRRIERPNFPITEGARDFAEMMVTTGELFILAHELGHVALNTGLKPPITGKDEEDADRYGLQFFLAGVQGHWNPRMAYVGPVFTIRNLAALQRVGVEFSDQYAPPAERLEILRDEIRKNCPSTQYFHEAATIMFFYMDMLDAIEKHMDSGAPAPPADWERILVRLLAELQEVAKGKVSISQYIDNIGHVFAGIDPAVARKATERLFDYYSHSPPPSEAFLSEALRLQMFAALVSVIDQLPPPLRPLFPAIPAVPAVPSAPRRPLKTGEFPNAGDSA